MLKKIEVIKQDHFGRGLSKADSKVIFIEDALPSEVVDVLVVKENKNIIEGTVIKRYNDSDQRRESDCKYYNECGGCSLRHQKYDKQVEFKKKKVEELLAKNKIDKSIRNVIACNNENKYRNKVVFRVSNNCLSLYKRNSNELVNIDKCLLLSDSINRLVVSINMYLKKNRPFEEITIKESSFEEILIDIKGELDKTEFLNYVKDFNVKVLINNNIHLIDDTYIRDKLFDKEFVVSSKSFFQVNKFQIENLYSIVIDFIKNKKINIALDLYCGTGTIGIIISDYVNEVVGIDIEKSSIDDAETNKTINNINNITFANDEVSLFTKDSKDIDLVIVDPPRSGLGALIVENIININSKHIIYISCDPNTLMRDLVYLKDSYEIETIDVVDMFPNTYHVETVCLLSKIYEPTISK